MDPLLIAQLVIVCGPKFVDELMDLFSKGETVTPEKWASLKSKIKTPFEELAGPK